MLQLTSEIMDYESGEMDEEEVLDFFQKLVDTGLVWELQGSYQRTAINLIYSGDIRARTADIGNV
tara:strand:+ start:1200 stop:1394 length:195 start_codon:yes stop_codon:yes gene_type:complete